MTWCIHSLILSKRDGSWSKVCGLFFFLFSKNGVHKLVCGLVLFYWFCAASIIYHILFCIVIACMLNIYFCFSYCHIHYVQVYLTLFVLMLYADTTIYNHFHCIPVYLMSMHANFPSPWFRIIELHLPF